MTEKKKDKEVKADLSENIYEKIDLQNQLAWDLRTRGTKESYAIATEAHKLSTQIQYQKGIGESLRSLGHYYNLISNYDTSFQHAIKAYEIFRELKDRAGEGSTLSLLGNVSFSLGDYENSLKYYILSMQIQKGLNDNVGLINLHTNVANIYGIKKDYNNALKYYFDGLEQSRDLKDETDPRIQNNKAVILGNIGSIYAEMGDYKEAIEYFMESNELALKCKNQTLEISNQNNLGEASRLVGDKTNAEKYFLKALQLAAPVEYKLGEAISLLGLGELALVDNKFDSAIEYIEKAREISENFLLHRIVPDIYDSLANAYSKKGDYETALRHHRKLLEVKEKDFNEESNKKMQNLMILHQVDVLKNEGESQRETNEKLKKLNDDVEEKSRRIIESIDYAKHIQDSILPHPSSLKQYFVDSFVFFRPKDIISGDFFWMFEKENEILVAAVDCTGHGVSGALMSVVSNNLLNQVTSSLLIPNPSFILNEVNHFMKRTLSAYDESGLRDSMDIALCAISKTRKELLFSGAHNSLYLISDGVLTEYKGDSISIGNNASVKFSNHKIKLKKGDCIYLFTDGFADQKGGPNRKKFYYEPFKNLVRKNCNKSMEKQRIEIDKAMTEWMAAESQIDDMLIIGIKID